MKITDNIKILSLFIYIQDKFIENVYYILKKISFI